MGQASSLLEGTTFGKPIDIFKQNHEAYAPIRIPMVIPFLGCLFGGTLYDLFIYTGPSPLNAHKFGVAGWRHEDWHVEENLDMDKEKRRQQSVATLDKTPTLIA